MDKQSLGEMCPYSRLICFLVLTLSSEDLIFWEGPALGGDIASHHGLGTLWRRELGSKWAEPGWWWGDRIFPFTAPVSFFLPLNLCWRTRKERRKKKRVHQPFFALPLTKESTQTSLLNNLCDFLHWFENSVLSILFLFKVYSGVFWWTFSAKEFLLIPRNYFRNLIHSNCKLP